MTDWRSLGARLATPFARAIESLIGDRVRAHYAAKFGTCKRCAKPLGGPSPSNLCEPCHADEVLEREWSYGDPRDSPDA